MSQQQSAQTHAAAVVLEAVAYQVGLPKLIWRELDSEPCEKAARFLLAGAVQC